MEDWKLQWCQLMENYRYKTRRPAFEANEYAVEIETDTNANKNILDKLAQEHGKELSSSYRLNNHHGDHTFWMKCSSEEGQEELHEAIKKMKAEVESFQTAIGAKSGNDMINGIGNQNKTTLIVAIILVITALILIFVWKPNR